MEKQDKEKCDEFALSVGDLLVKFAEKLGFSEHCRSMDVELGLRFDWSVLLTRQVPSDISVLVHVRGVFNEGSCPLGHYPLTVVAWFEYGDTKTNARIDGTAEMVSDSLIEWLSGLPPFSTAQ